MLDVPDGVEHTRHSPAPRASLLDDRERIHDPLELLPDVRCEGGGGRAHAADLAAAVEIVGAVQGDVLRRLLAEEEQRDPELGGVLLMCATADTLDARVIRHVPAVLSLEDLPAFDLPALPCVLDIVQALANELIRKSHRRPPWR